MFTMRTVHELYTDPDGSPAEGFVLFWPSTVMINGGTTAPSRVRADIDVFGSITTLLCANDDVGTTPVGDGVYYWVEEHIKGAPDRRYAVQIPAAGSGTIELSTLATVETPEALTFPVAGPPGPAGPTGPAGATGPQGPPGADGADGTGAVASVNGRTGAVVGLAEASDVTTGLAGKANTSHTHPATDLASGTVDIARLPTGTAAGTVALGNHTHAGSGGYATVTDEGSSLTQRTVLNFIGAGVTAADNPGTGRTDVTIPGGGSASGVFAVINVKTDYGALGNNSTDDATALQNAITAAGTATYGGIVYLPPGIYITNKYLLTRSNVILMGAGMDLTTIKAGPTFRTGGGVAPDGGGYSIIQATGVSRQNIEIHDLTIDGNESADRTALAASGVRLNSYLIDMRDVTGLRIARVATRNSWTYNIALINCSKFSVEQCDVRDPGTTGVYDQLDGIHILGCHNGRIAKNFVDNGNGGDADDALVAHVTSWSGPCYDLVFTENIARGGANGNGIQLAGGSGGVIRDITISDNTFWGCRCGVFNNWYDASGNQPIRSIKITGNTIRDTTIEAPISVHIAADGKWEDFTIANNTIDGYGSAGSPFVMGLAIEGGNGSHGISITGNTLRNGYSRGIYFSEGSPLVRDYTLSSNIIDMSAAGAAPLAIILGSSLDGVMMGNIVTGRGTADGVGVYMNSTASAQATNQILMANRVRAFATGVQITNAAGNNPTNTQFIGNNTQGCGTGTNFGTATVTQANNL